MSPTGPNEWSGDKIVFVFNTRSSRYWNHNDEEEEEEKKKNKKPNNPPCLGSFGKIKGKQF